MDIRKKRIVVASSGLGHISRGIETWADDTANALRQLGMDIVLYQGGGKSLNDWTKTIPCWKRFDDRTLKFVDLLKNIGGWRIGFGSGYQIEQTTFSYNLWKQIHLGADILHVQDPWIAYCFEVLHRYGLSRPKVILAHGTEESVEFLGKFHYLQHLAPCYLEQNTTLKLQKRYAIPNFVNTSLYYPGDKQHARTVLNLPQDKTITLCVAAIKKPHKRVDELVNEYTESILKNNGILLIIGSLEADTDDIIAYGKNILGENILFRIGVPRNQMPLYYQAADIFAMASIHEMMPIAMLEALATGLPIACNDTPVMNWIVGSAGYPNDISIKGSLANQLNKLAMPTQRDICSTIARERALRYFSSVSVVNQIIDMYKDILDETA